MWKRRKSFGVGSEVEAALRSQRVDADQSFVDGLSEHVLAQRSETRAGRSRLAFAGAVSVFILGTFASFGGLSYAASGAAGTYHAVKQVAVKHSLIVSVPKSSASAQYAPKPKPHKTQPPAAKVAGAQLGVAGVAGVSSGGTLPFTGLSLLATFILSLSLIVLGVALRRRERKN
jgi:hypothetical protein